jgi:hypothetical protein
MVAVTVTVGSRWLAVGGRRRSGLFPSLQRLRDQIE